MGNNQFWDDLAGQTAIVGGASKGLGRCIASELVIRGMLPYELFTAGVNFIQGANVYLLARGKSSLDTALANLKPLCHNGSQWIRTHALDLGDSTQVDKFIASLTDLPTILFCVAGGAAEEMGFIADLTAAQLRTCFTKNYFSAAFITQALLRRWIKKDISSNSTPHHVILTGSTAALVAIPGYGAYTPTKTALRALADTLRQEAMMYPQDIHIHCSLPGTIFTDTFYEEQETKPALTKQLEGSDDFKDGLTAEEVASRIMDGLSKDEFLIPVDFQTTLLINNMRGPSPPNHGLLDWVLGFLASLIMPFIRISMDRQSKAYYKPVTK
ncbi:MAG: hypothetical protein M1836_006048 [Candelina mexicana]|nr:MAG: hypothetical protein M1836_006048 [Candelina mexicana]